MNKRSCLEKSKTFAGEKITGRRFFSKRSSFDWMAARCLSVNDFVFLLRVFREKGLPDRVEAENLGEEGNVISSTSPRESFVTSSKSC